MNKIILNVINRAFVKTVEENKNKPPFMLYRVTCAVNGMGSSVSAHRKKRDGMYFKYLLQTVCKPHYTCYWSISISDSRCWFWPIKPEMAWDLIKIPSKLHTCAHLCPFHRGLFLPHTPTVTVFVVVTTEPMQGSEIVLGRDRTLPSKTGN